eukprot:gnl/MRDRNA2_/MRDRNA2_86743_c0_seq15.p1 gnl/MRDRNA2_/MRDRNA2_86743_c0~~gnl/MRDRNA2_/MRDRNA2_86743_c0_seq15.p1  ORF type:complete len:250 (-),score=31.56 gnl/MRDRNA2_/MRDRNA2_86743_c0_seq15:612-1361(-)
MIGSGGYNTGFTPMIVLKASPASSLREKKKTCRVNSSSYKSSAPRMHQTLPQSTFTIGFAKRDPGKPRLATKWETLFDIQQQLAPDHSIFNVAHHIFGKHFDLTRMEKLAREIVDASTNRFSKLNTIWDKTVSKNRSLAFMGHPPQHFAENPENIYGGHSRGTCTKHGTVVAQNCCSNDIKNIMKQDMQVKNEVCRKVAEEYHVGWVDVFQTMVPYGNMHFPENKDCTQYKISPSSWTGTMQNVLESFQ